MQQKTRRPVQFEITEQTRTSVAAWIEQAHLTAGEYLFPSRVTTSPHLSTRQYARIVESWVESIGLDSATYGTHTMRRTKATLIYRGTKNLRAVQLLLGHTKLESTQLLRVKERLTDVDKSLLEIISPIGENFVNLEAVTVRDWPNVSNLQHVSVDYP
jgi:integrase